MKTLIYMIRHGQSEANNSKVFAGNSDFPLTEKGHLQAERSAEFFKDIKIDKIYASDLKRAYQTAEHTGAIFNLEIIPDRLLREIRGGKWENNTYDYIQETFKDTYGVWLSDIDKACPDNGESVTDLQKRVSKRVEEIAKENEGKSVAIFTHATPIRAFMAFCKKDMIKDTPWPTNGSVSVFSYEDGRFESVDYSLDKHMGELVTSFPKNV